MPHLSECLLRHFKRGAFEHKRNQRGRLRTPFWPWPAAPVFDPRGDDPGISVDDGSIHDDEQMRAVLAATPLPYGDGNKDPDDYGSVALERSKVSSLGYNVQPDPIHPGGSLPKNPAHAIICLKPEQIHLDFRADLWGIALGYSPPPNDDVPDGAWERWEAIAAYDL